ncbi:hypothetical protein H4W80_000266 [Nonomuraea angiospora]|uniref:Uncharacterized protein n=1 Tax=Nonomuraea angiospora TaxID=46172 RepID=A0ABR9LMX2_9ACTN|nr:hypothetical protein [Nonomuraea angiospora]
MGAVAGGFACGGIRGGGQLAVLLGGRRVGQQAVESFAGPAGSGGRASGQPQRRATGLLGCGFDGDVAEGPVSAGEGDSGAGPQLSPDFSGFQEPADALVEGGADGLEFGAVGGQAETGVASNESPVHTESNPAFSACFAKSSTSAMGVPLRSASRAGRNTPIFGVMSGPWIRPPLRR